MPIRLLGVAVAIGVALVVVPELIPAGPTAGLDAAGLLDKGSFLLAVGAIFLGGLLTSLTPCVYPLIPITVGVFGARQAQSRLRAVALTSTYVGGMGVVFSILGVAAALSGKAFGSVLTNNWVVLGLAIFLLALAMSMFGAFELALPSSVATRLNSVSKTGLTGALLMGAVSGFLAAPCTGPVLSGVLAYVAKTQNPVIGGALLFVYAMGIGVPFFLIGVFTIRLPKSGVWMEWVKSIFGIALVALAASYVRDAFAPVREGLTQAGASLGHVGAVSLAMALAVIGVLVGAIHLSFKEDKGQFIAKAVGVSAVVFALLLRVAAPAPTWGATVKGDVLSWTLNFRPSAAKSPKPFEQALAQAKEGCKPVMIDFFAEFCAACKELDKLTYSRPEVAKQAAQFVTVKVDGTDDDEVLDALYERFKVQGLPTVAFIDPKGNVLEDPRVLGFLPPDEFLTEMKKVKLGCTATP